MNPNPQCDRDDCRFTNSGGQITCSYYQPIYDKKGKNINPDGNIHTSVVTCISCSKSWTAVTRYGKTVFNESK
jgi:hypothetical protein